MPYEEWQRVQLTEAKVLAYLKQALCRQNAKPERDEIRLVKQKYSFVYKAYSRKMAKLLTDEMRAPVPIYQAVLDISRSGFQAMSGCCAGNAGSMTIRAALFRDDRKRAAC